MPATRLTLRTHIILLFVVSVVLVTAVATVIGVSIARDEVRNGVEQRQQESSLRAAQAVNAFLGASERNLNVTALLAPRGYFVPRVDKEALGSLLDPLLGSSEDFAAAMVVDHQGMVVVARPDVPRWSSSDFSRHEAFLAVRQSGRAQLELDTDQGPPAWAVPLPATGREPTPFYLMAVLKISRVESILYQHVDAQSDALLVDDRVQVVASTLASQPQQPITNWPGVSEAAAGKAVEAPSLDGSGRVLARLSRLSGAAASVVIMIPKSQVEILQAQIVRTALLTGGALGLTAVGLGIFAASTITRPVAEVRSATHRMRQGDLAARAEPRGPKELQELATDFNMMASTLASEWEQRVRLQNRLEELVDQRTAELEIKREEMELFFYGVGHDIKSPIISIGNISQMLDEQLAEKDIDRAKLKDLSERIGRSTANLRNLIMELLAFAQIERTRPDPRPVRLKELARAIADEQEPQARRRGIRLDVSGKPVRLMTDPDRLRHVLGNLVENAIKYMPDGHRGARARIHWAVDGDHLVIRVTDNGAGIPKHAQPQLFKPFSRYLSKSSNAVGAGLGLSIVKRLTESLQGTVTLESDEGQGASFILRLPLKWREPAS